MENNLKIFEKEGMTVRTVIINNEPWFVAKDVAEVLQYTSTDSMGKLTGHIPEEWKGRNPIHTPGGVQDVLVLSEQGLYFFLGRSDKPKALPFQKWIASEVLPEIRKTGTYSLTVPKTYAEALRLAADQYEQIAEQQLQIEKKDQQIAEDKPKVEFYNTIIDAKGTFDWGTTAKMLKYPKFGRSKLTAALREYKIIMNKGASHNIPYERYMQAGLFIVNESITITPYGNTKVNYTTLVTQKGVDAIKKLLDKKIASGELIIASPSSDILIPDFFDYDS